MMFSAQISRDPISVGDMKTKLIIRALVLFIALNALPSLADDYDEDLMTFSRTVQTNDLTKNGYWLETKNAFGDWEKLILIFGYFDPGDKANCEKVRQLYATGGMSDRYRCIPVN
ncbi:MAG: hypothetical protein ABJJ37_27030 [Roseibium sp.]